MGSPPDMRTTLLLARLTGLIAFALFVAVGLSVAG